MPAAWISAGSALLGAYNSSKSSGGSGGSGPTNAFNGPNTGLANSGWASGFGGLENVSQGAYNAASPLYNQSLSQQQGINYDPYLGSQQNVGQQYGNLSNIALNQMGNYQQAGQQMQGAGSQILNRAFDLNMAQYNQTANNLTGQVNAQQAARGLGNSPVGAQELGNTLGNFNTQWNTQQLQNEATGIQSANMANNAAGQDYSAMLAAGQAGAGYQQQAGQIPLNAQQYVAGQPAANASAYTQEMGGLGSLYGNVTGQALPYITGGQGAQQYNTGYNTQQNAANMNLLTQGAQGLYNQSNTPGSWMNNIFNSNSYGTTSQQSGAQQGGFYGVEDYGAT